MRGMIRAIPLTLTLTLLMSGCLTDFSLKPGPDATPGPDAVPGCGDGVIGPGEVCDGTNLGGWTCESLNYASGTLSCNALTCELDESGCVPAPVCGDDVLDATEMCEDSNAVDWDGCTGCVISEFLVNLEIEGDQGRPVVVSVGTGFVVVYSTVTQNGGLRLLGQRFDSDATPDASAFFVSPQVEPNMSVNRHPEVAPLSDGSFVVVWTRIVDTDQDVVGQLFAQNLVAIGGVFLVSDEPTHVDDTPDVAGTNGGGFVVTWRGDDGGYGRALSRRFDFDANPLGPSLRADSSGAFQPYEPRVAVATGGGFLLVWTDDADATDSFVVRGRLHDADGSLSGAMFDVAEDTAGEHATPDVVATLDGGYLVVWEGLVNGSWDIYARRFDAAGAPLSGDLLTNEILASDQLRPRVTLGPTGLLVAWETQVGADWDVAARILGEQPILTSVELKPHLYLPTVQSRPAVATLASGQYIVAWQSDAQDGSVFGVFAQRLTTDGSPLGVGP